MSYNKLVKGLSATTSSIDPLELIKELKNLNRQAKKLDPKKDVKSSPYLQDQADYKPEAVKDTVKEREWRHVSSSNKDILKTILDPNHANKRLNII